MEQRHRTRVCVGLYCILFIEHLFTGYLCSHVSVFLTVQVGVCVWVYNFEMCWYICVYIHLLSLF